MSLTRALIYNHSALRDICSVYPATRLYHTHALNSEHAQYALNAYWLEWTEHAP